MAINKWWRHDPNERYWLEITNREDIGTNLLAPQANDRGEEYWSYALVREVRPGDLVLHWDKNHGPGVVGYSHVRREPFASTITWQSRGTYGRQRSASGPEPAWEAPLGGYRRLQRPVTQTRLREVEPTIRALRDRLTEAVAGPLYFPFALSDARPLRAAQGYLTKLPRELVEELPELRELRQTAISEPHEPEAADLPPTSLPKPRRSTGYGRQRDANRRQAVERYAMDLVLSHYRSLGYEVEDVGDHSPWDVTARKNGTEVHVEVKGSTTTREAIDLTEGEVRHAEGIPTCLVVIDQIELGDDLHCHGGRWRTWNDWAPAREELVATAYRYPLPEAGHGGSPFCPIAPG
ncbi:EVE domain-containing protein [Streptomyces sp. NBC_00885]|uniref:protein NO VEIN domain-containing protein n=1 Tax=Streptomyces sp. NBC_00885 TaxID=2975857 RepID=UPI00386F9602|nr:EVE domain-containing protein [Streptomyces sp. NBC_00885]